MTQSSPIERVPILDLWCCFDLNEIRSVWIHLKFQQNSKNVLWFFSKRCTYSLTPSFTSNLFVFPIKYHKRSVRRRMECTLFEQDPFVFYFMLNSHGSKETKSNGNRHTWARSPQTNAKRNLFLLQKKGNSYVTSEFRRWLKSNRNDKIYN